MREQRSGRARLLVSLCAVVLLLLLIALLLPGYLNVSRWRPRVEASLSNSLGSRVHIQGMQAELLPFPAFVLSGFSVEARDGSAEPVIHADTVTARVRWLPLLRRRIEVARISLEDASLNLERNAQGEWNFDRLLQATPALPAGPTTQRRAAGRFPYLEVTRGRINFKRGPEKLPFSLTDADLAFWLESPGEWRLRLRATPQRTDIPDGSVGEVQVRGSVQRVGESGQQSWRDAAIHLEVEAREVPLGQLSRVLFAQDMGWRGVARANAVLAGSIADANTQLVARVEGLRREDFVPASAMDLEVRCVGAMQPFEHSASWSNCTLPAGSGSFASHGRVVSGESLEWTLAANAVPAEWLLNGVRVFRQGLSPDLHLGGTWSGDIQHSPDAQQGSATHLDGVMVWSHAALRGPGLGQPIVLDDVALRPGAANPTPPASVAMRNRAHAKKPQPAAIMMPLSSSVVSFALGAPQPLMAQFGLGRQGYLLRVGGSADAGKLLGLLRMAGLAHAWGVQSVTGVVSPQMVLRGGWWGVASAASGTISGSALQLTTAWLPGPIAVAKASVTLSAAGPALDNATATWAQTDWQLRAAKGACDPAPCGWQLQAHSANVNAAAITNAFRNADRGLFAIFSSTQQRGWPAVDIHADADAVSAWGVIVHHATANLHAENSALTIVSADADVFNGSVQSGGVWHLDTSQAALHLGAANLNLDAAASAFHEKWGTGTAEANATLQVNGNALSGDYSLMVRNGALQLNGLPQFSSWQMSGTVSNSGLQIARSSLMPVKSSTPLRVTGTINTNRSAALVAQPLDPPNAPTQQITGRLGGPR